MHRRHFLQTTLTLTAGLSLRAAAARPRYHPPAEPFKRLFAPHFGMFNDLAGNDLLEELRLMHELGFRALEDNGLMGRDVATQTKIGEELARLGMQMGVFVVGFDGWPPQTTLTSGQAEWRDTFLTTCRQAVEVAKRVNAKWMTVVPGNYDRSLPLGFQTANVVDSLRRAADIFEPHGLVMVLEPLSDTPDLFLRYTDQTYEICKAVASPSCKILYDIYHLQRNEGNLTANIDRAWDEIAYFQIGDVPGRKEPTTGEINFLHLFQHIYARGYRGILGMEHGVAGAGKAGEQALVQAYRQVDNF